MHVAQLSLRDFRNYERLELDLSSGVTLLYGPNAAGKTTILEALFYLATTRSPRTSTDREIVRWDAQGDIGVPPFAQLRCAVQRHDGAVRLEVLVQRRMAEEGHLLGTSVKTVRVDRKAVRAMDLVGHLRVVLFTPADLALVSGGPAERRQYLNVMLSQLDGRYLRTLSHFNKVVQQRNSLLRSWREGRRPVRSATEELEFWNQELSRAGAYIIHERLKAVQELNGIVGPLFQQVTAKPAPLIGAYQSTVAGIATDAIYHTVVDAFLSQLKRLRDEEIGRGQTLVGPHRDDLVLTMGDVSVGTYGSRGQQRAATLALKLGEAAMMEARAGESPVLLLDDVLSELDAIRQAHVLEVIRRPEQQTIVTATGMSEFDGAFLARARTIRVEEGRLYPS
ncbi:MAG: Recombinational DNA repair ATPase RecF [Chloroflexi bacterium AL-W]|nr:Recombinational DNA repair ATPase RecF [Chloroflexi bacterium AL-N1]NOK65090.1 Recombinational DNA repair ATPase RecF [Chloroflexi bacterium AL-N10]NOK72643.1 Recombinational DNA repair ATPase RecF [Chloroflexi bacterium AL-N5]NOK79269.1 Recombinational DNA repair ATPase RecF [Chloroflexi bacterium AL-W]NOK87185.1 Recombinational DNA repair ATPase RecF [Chloroflexi bacterium AL-N15]